MRVRVRVCLLVVREEIKQVDADDCGLFLRWWNDAFEFFIEALQNTNVTLELFNIFEFHREESRVLISLTYISWLMNALNGGTYGQGCTLWGHT